VIRNINLGVRNGAGMLALEKSLRDETEFLNCHLNATGGTIDHSEGHLADCDFVDSLATVERARLIAANTSGAGHPNIGPFKRELTQRCLATLN